MKKLAIILLLGGLILTVLFLGIWIAGLFIAETFGGLIHLFLLLSIVTGFGFFAGAIMLLISLLQKK